MNEYKDSIILRQYQETAINNLRAQMAKGFNRIVLTAPTGSGKTVIFSKITQLAHSKNNRVLIVTNRKELLQQTGNIFLKFRLRPVLIDANYKKAPAGAICIAMIETLHRRLKRDDYSEFIKSFDLIIIDEVHINAFNKMFESLVPDQKVIGVTATPIRRNPAPALSKYFDKLIDVCQISELINGGFLAEPFSYGIPINIKGIKMKGGDYDDQALDKLYDDNIKYTGAVLNYEKYSLGKKTLVFCASINNSQKLCNEFISCGHAAKHFDCYMNDNDRTAVLKWFEQTPDAILCNVGILTTGFDCPGIETILLYRATKSLALFLQMVGRGSRIAPGKKSFTILDFGNNIKTLGFWESDQIWSLENPVKKKLAVAPVKECKNCGALVSANATECKYCGYIFPIKEKKKTEIEIILERLTPSQIQKFSENCTVSELEQIRIARGYKLGWIIYKLKTIDRLQEYESLRGFKRGWAYWQIKKIK